MSAAIGKNTQGLQIWAENTSDFSRARRHGDHFTVMRVGSRTTSIQSRSGLP
jgi:hypothetical protein